MELSQMTRGNTILLVCDVQKQARPMKIKVNESVNTKKKIVDYKIFTILRALEFSKIIGIPILKSEQVFKKEWTSNSGEPITYGETDKLIQAFFNENEVPSIRAKEYKKTTLSMINDQIRFEIVGNSCESLFFNTKFAVIVGFETHLAVWKTCEDLKKLRIMPVILMDGVCSSKELDSDVCLKMMQKSYGMVVTTLEIWAHKFDVDENDAEFGEILKLFKGKLVKY